MDDRQRAIAKTVLQMAYADGELHPTEREVLETALFEVGGTLEELQGAENEPAPDLDKLVPDKQDRLHLMELILQVCMADGRLSFDEFFYMSTVAEKLALTQDEMTVLRDKVLGPQEEV